MKRRARAAVLSRLASMGITDLEEHIKFEVAYTPRAWRSLYNLKRGSAFGLSHNFLQVGYMRPHNRHAHYRNLYFVGSSTHPGTGLPMVLLSAQLTTERILEEQAVGARHSDGRQHTRPECAAEPQPKQPSQVRQPLC
jgi:phytoene dehydrogenase-like protein